MSTSQKIIPLLALLATGGTTLSAEPRVTFENNRLAVDGEPFFFYGCWGTPNLDYTEFKRRHFNTAFMSASAAVSDGPKAAAAGLMVIPYPAAPQWDERVKAAAQSIADKEWLLAWNIGDDLKSKEHIEAALRVRDTLRAIDPQRRPIMFDAIGLYDQFARIPDMWCAYAYPLVKDAAAAPPARKPGGLEQYGDWLGRMRLLGRSNGFFWTWAQCHVQVWYCETYLGGTAKDKWQPSRFPDGDHLRLVAAHAISAGCRGLMWFVSRYFQDDFLGRDRYAAAAGVGCQLDVIGPLIAQGTTGQRIETSDDHVWATPIDFPGGRLICLLRTGNNYHYQPDAAEARDVRFEPGIEGRIYQIGFDFHELPEPTCSFHLTTWLLVTQDKSLVERLRRVHRAALPDMARFATEELEARLTKVRPVFAELGSGQPALQRAEQLLSQARQCLAEADWSRAGHLAEEGLTTIRAAQHAAWHGTWTDVVLAAGLKMTDFYMLPRVARDIELVKRDAWGPNRLANGSFETDDGWGGARLGRGPDAKAAVVDGVGRSGRGLRLVSDGPTMYEGQPRDWVTANAVSDKLPAAPGEIWEIAAWVRMPKPLAQTARGLTIALFAYDADGQAIRGYGAQDLEAVQVEATDGWQRMRLVVPLHSDAVRAIAARLALCGKGEAYVDDVTVRRLATQPAR